MKKVSYKLKIIITIAFSLMVSYVNVTSADKKIETVAYKKTPVGAHGRLNVKGTKLVDQYGKEIQIQGVSTHGINWDVGKPYVNYQSFQNLRDEWGVNCIRIAMYTQEYNGYCVTDEREKKDLLETIDSAVKYTKKLGMYIIIDWHVLSDQNPLKYKKEAKEFFRLMSISFQHPVYFLFHSHIFSWFLSASNVCLQYFQLLLLCFRVMLQIQRTPRLSSVFR